MRGRQLQKPERSQHLVNDPLAVNPILGRTNTESTNLDRWAADSRTPPFQMALQQSGELPGLSRAGRSFPMLMTKEQRPVIRALPASVTSLLKEVGGIRARDEHGLDAIRMPATAPSPLNSESSVRCLSGRG